MVRSQKTPETLAPHVRQVFTAMARAYRRQPHPEVVLSLSAQYCAAIPGHVVTFDYEVAATPRGRRHSYYRLHIVGQRFNGAWTFRPSEVEDILRALSASGTA